MFGRILSDKQVITRIDRVIYALLYIAFIFYFPTTLLPDVFLSKNEKGISSQTMQAIPVAHSINVNIFYIPFVGCIKRISATVHSKRNDFYTARYWGAGYYDGICLDYKLVKEGGQIDVYSFKPLTGDLELTPKIIKSMQGEANYAFRKLFYHHYERMLKNKRRG